MEVEFMLHSMFLRFDGDLSVNVPTEIYKYVADHELILVTGEFDGQTFVHIDKDEAGTRLVLNTSHDLAIHSRALFQRQVHSHHMDLT